MSYQSDDVILQKYRVEAMVGQGAFADVYRATYLESNTLCALKVLRKDAPGLGSTEFGEYQNRFSLEAQLGAKLNHPNIIKAYDFEKDSENLILVMEYAAKGSLGQVIDQMRRNNKQMPVKNTLNIILQISNGLAVLHDLDVVHRDLKPNNILFNTEGQAKIADLGLAQVAGGPSMRSQLSSPLAHPGTPAYMSPEQKASTQYLTPASDIFSVGLILFEMLTGRVYANQRPGTRASSLSPDVPVWLDDLLVRTLDEDPKKRPWNGKELATLLYKQQRDVSQQPGVIPLKAEIKQPVVSTANQPNLRVAPQKTIQKKKSNIWATALPLLIAVVVLGFLTVAIIFGIMNSYSAHTAISETPTKRSVFASDTPNISPVLNKTPIYQSTLTAVLPQNFSITNTPTEVPVPILLTETPTLLPTETYTPLPSETNACTLYFCKDTADQNVCAYGLSQTASQLIVTFKFQQINLIEPLSLSVHGESLGCEILTSSPDHIYCAGNSITSGTEMFSLYSGSGENLICSGELLVPKYVTPVPTPKKKRPGSYP